MPVDNKDGDHVQRKDWDCVTRGWVEKIKPVKMKAKFACLCQSMGNGTPLVHETIL